MLDHEQRPNIDLFESEASLDDPGTLNHSPARALRNDGERMLPELAAPNTYWAHIYRYRFASRFVATRDVLDIACGEGYGSYSLIQAKAASVIGVDISVDTCAHARDKYGIDARVGSAESIPLPSNSVDVVISFETVEHVTNPCKFVAECGRVLRKRGMLIISTPNRVVYSPSGKHNDFHCNEMVFPEFRELLSTQFRRVEYFTQMPASAGLWSLRSLAARNSRWKRVRGYWRLRNLLSTMRFDEVSEYQRRTPAAMILAHDSFTSRLFNQYVVRRRRSWTCEQPEYMVAVARF